MAKKLTPVGVIGIRNEAAVARMWQMNNWAQKLAAVGECPQCFAHQMQLACDELCQAGTAAAEALGFELADGWGGK